MVWNGVTFDVSRLVGSGWSERFALRFVVFGNVGRDSLHGTYGFWGWSSCGLCGGDFKSTSLGRLDKPEGGVRLLDLGGQAREKSVGIVPSTHGGSLIRSRSV